MECDPFEMLGLPRRPWLGKMPLRAAFQDKARALHPDAAGGDAGRFAALNAAHALLADPAARLQFLAGQAPAPDMPADPALGFRVGGCLCKAAEFLSRLAAARSPLERVLLAGDVKRNREAVEALLAEVDAALGRADSALRDIDSAWPDVVPARLAALGTEFRFLQRWRMQLRERALALTLGSPAS